MKPLNQIKKMTFAIFFITIASTMFWSCGNCDNKTQQNRAKYVFYFIGDGMGLSHITLTESYLAAISDSNYSTPRLNMTQMEHVGLARTHAKNRLITGSAAAGTALATGSKTTINTIGMTPDKKEPLYSIAHSAKKANYKVGVISSVTINHATPAAFYAHVPERSHYYDIGLQIGETNFDLFGGGGFDQLTGKDKDKQSLTEILSNKGFNILNRNSEFLNLQKLDKNLIFINQNLDTENAMQYAIDFNETDLTLAQTVAKATELLYNPDGFFLMVEGGKIDWANHSNDAATAIHDIIDFDNAIATALEFYKKHPENTLIVICSDHETGGLSLGNRESKYESNPALLKYQQISIDSLSRILKNYRDVKKRNVNFAEITDTLKKYVGIGNSEMMLTKEELAELENCFNNAMKGNTDKIDHKMFKLASKAINILASKVGIAWATGAHTWQPTMVFASGTGSALFAGYHDNTDLVWKLAELMQIEHKNDKK
ncbi:MAG TPA: alkaline phosphatase [Salinivirgaceae bacterium]|nr:alkaline phosphatase [Salinivirgaceae bacterium]HQA76361.1 alkaline phosphatase [Salinivirgaceae bacterium]